jgi:hypothetical protein
MRKRSEIGPDGFTFTAKIGHSWCEDQVSAIRKLSAGNLNDAIGCMQPYRHDGCEMLGLHIEVNEEFIYSGIITANDGEYEGELLGDEVFVPDIIEAIHLAGIIFQSLGIPVKIGKVTNELNPEVLGRPLVGSETNGRIRGC